MKALASLKAIAVMVLLCTITTTSGFAADLPAGPLPAHAIYAPALQYNWNGFYVGINGGYGFGTTNWTTSTLGATGQYNVNGALAGGTIGVNYQAGSFLFGFEADADWAGFKGNSSAAYCSALTAGAICQTKQTWLGTGRGRLGFAINRLLVFGTAGGAIGNIRAGLVPPGTFDTASAVGWTVGGGLEAGISENWSIKVEYLYLDFGNGSCNANCGVLAPGIPASVTVPLTENLVRAGINYRLPF